MRGGASGLVGPGLARVAKCECKGLCSIWALSLGSTIDRHSGDLVFHMYGAPMHKVYPHVGSISLEETWHVMGRQDARMAPIVYAHRKYEPAEAVAPPEGRPSPPPSRLARPSAPPPRQNRS
jgi:hypothetical protein